MTDELAVRQPSSAEVHRARGRIQEMFKSAAGSDPEAVMERIVSEISESQSLDGILGTDPIKATDVLDVALRITGFQPQHGEMGAFAVIEADVIDPEWVGDSPILVTCGGEVVLAQLVRAAELSMIPFTARITARETARGQTVFKLARVPGNRINLDA